VVVVICLGVVPWLAGCGENNAEEPLSLARSLGAPTAGTANVYCVADAMPEK
jgi:hypothetical protein